MPGRELSLRRYRWLVRLSLLAGVASVVAGLWAALHALWGPALLGLGAGILLLWPSQHFRIRPEPGSERVLSLLTKKECSLCDEARILLPTLLEGTPFRVEETDIDTERFLRRHFRTQVPVLLWQGETLAQLRFEPAEVRARLAEIQARLPPAA